MSSRAMWDREQRLDDGAELLVATWRKADKGKETRSSVPALAARGAIYGVLLGSIGWLGLVALVRFLIW
ncbi:MAG: hypothetical protein ACE5FA_05845 [Dehalococcoidia bacterium]